MLSLVLLTACATQRPTTVPHLNTAVRGAAYGTVGGAAVGALSGPLGIGAGAVLGGVSGAFIGYDIHKDLLPFGKLEEYLAQRGVQIIKLGEEITLVLPADRFFYRDTARIRWHSRADLDLIARYINEFNMVDIGVSVHSDNSGIPMRNIALTELQAKNITDYLWSRGIDTRIMVGKGFASQYPIATNSTIQGQRYNRRIEIYFRTLTA